jgi:flagellar biogenesis protein FliO
MSENSFFWMFVQTVLALGLVLVLAHIVLRVIFPRIFKRAGMGIAGEGNGLLRVAESVRLSEQVSMYIIEVAGRWYLATSSASGSLLLHELDATAVEDAYAEKNSQAARAPFWNSKANLAARFAQVVWGKK